MGIFLILHVGKSQTKEKLERRFADFGLTLLSGSAVVGIRPRGPRWGTRVVPGSALAFKTDGYIRMSVYRM